MFEESTLVSAVITTYNRYSSLLSAIDSIKNQTYKNIEIIVVNDKSTSEEYYQERPKNVIWIDLEKSSREIFGYPAVGYTRNIGIQQAKGQFIAFLDDDDSWLPEKIDLQMAEMKKQNIFFSCTEAFMITNNFSRRNYQIYHKEYFKDFCENFFEKNYGAWNGKLPSVFDIELIHKHNFIIQSSVMIKKTLFEKSGLYKEENPQYGVNGEDWELWRRVLLHSKCLHLDTPLVNYLGGAKKANFLKRLKEKVNYTFQKYVK